MFRLSLCSKCFYLICHKNAIFDQKMTISKYPLSFDTMFYNQIDDFFASHFNDLVACYEKKFNTHTFACICAKLKEIVYDILPFQIYCHLFHCLRGFNVVNRCQYRTKFYFQSVPLSAFLDRKFTSIFFHEEFIDNFLADEIYLNF